MGLPHPAVTCHTTPEVLPRCRWAASTDCRWAAFVTIENTLADWNP